ncbi:MAG: metallophosphoesterase [Lachnospiraceae bacterium]|nr:metallophosphoesterase [Lachnospiraceae bacterium]
MRIHIKPYTVKSEKIGKPFRCVLISDLHNHDFGDANAPILEMIRSLDPDFILFPGDLVIGLVEYPLHVSEAFAKEIPKIAPVYFSNGNHESELRIFDEEAYRHCMKIMKESGIHILNNSSEFMLVNDNPVCIHGLELGLHKYRKFRVPHISRRHIRERLGYMEDQDCFHILMAHNPEFGDLYCRWGADLIVSGHFHGGLVRSPFSGRNLLSPYGFFYPRHGYGQCVFTESGKIYRNTSDLHPAGENVPPGECLVTSAGLGDHKPLPRLFDPYEIVCIDVMRA